MSLLSALTVAFIILKLIGVIAWSWWWVLSPLILQASIVAILIVLAFLGVIEFDR